jgi:hypothetical protein
MLNTHRSRNQPSGATLPEGKPKSPESKENLLETGTSGNNIILQGRKATIGFRRDHQSQPDERVQYTGRHATTTTHAGDQRYQEATRSLMRIDRH